MQGGGERVALKSNVESKVVAPTSKKTTPEQREELLLNLTQVHVRLGDLQR